MKKRQGKRVPDLSQWYKPSREGAAARRYLLKNADIPIADEAGGIGKEADVKSTQSHAKKGEQKNTGKSKA